MSYIIPPSLDNVETDSPVGPNPPEGSRVISAWAWPPFTRLGQAPGVHTMQIDFYSPYDIRGIDVRQVIDTALGWWFMVNNLEPATYILWQKDEWSVSIPTEFCILDSCFEPPFAGETLNLVYFYRLWVMSAYLPGASPMARPTQARPDARPLAASVIIAFAIAFAIVAATIVGIVSLREGDIEYSDVQDSVHTFITAPGENIKVALTWPLIAFGGTLVALSFILPAVSTKVAATVPVGGGVITGEVGAAAKAPAKKKKKKS